MYEIFTKNKIPTTQPHNYTTTQLHANQYLLVSLGLTPDSAEYPSLPPNFLQMSQNLERSNHSDSTA